MAAVLGRVQAAGDLSGLFPVGLGEALFFGSAHPGHGEFRLVQVEEPQQPGFGGPVGLHPAIGQDVADAGFFPERAADEDGAVAGQRVLFRAHEGHAVPGHACPQPVEPGQEARVRGHALEIGHPVHVDPGHVHARPELMPQEHVPDALGLQVNSQAVLVELGLVGAAGQGTHVGQGGDGVLAQKGREPLQGVGGVADGVESNMPVCHGDFS